MKKGLALFLALVLTLASATCTALAEEKAIEINWMVENISEGERAALNEYMIAPFHKEFPNIHINMLPTPDSVNVLKTQMAAGEGPVLFNLDGPTDVAELQKSGRVRDLTEYYTQYGWNDIIADWAKQTCKFDEKYYAIPKDVEAMWLWYNPTEFKENGWTVPTNYAELNATCASIAQAGLIPMAFGNGDITYSIDHWLSAVYNLYSGVTDLKAALRGEKKWTDDTLKGAITTLKE
ncbi:MAG: extracellular solute-binding protein, partial [Clostridia bacterium]